MARFYAKFDSGSAGWVTGLDSTHTTASFNRLRIAANSASAALLRAGLIASRSALSADVYADLSASYENGSLGIYFPPDSGPRSTNNSTFISWSNAYTSSVPGIVTPADFRTRPTASILSTQTTLVGPANPANPIGVSYTTFTSASAAVTTILNSIQDGAGVSAGPYARTSNRSSRRQFSIWHDPDLQYFGWDDFTPGTPQSFALSDPGGGTDTFFFTTPFYVTMSWSGTTFQYSNDRHAIPVVQGIVHATGSSTPLQTLSATQLLSGSSQYFWQITITPDDGQFQFDVSVRLRDSQSLAEGFTSEGTAASLNDSNQIRLRRLYYQQGWFASTYDGTCASFNGGAQDYYRSADLGDFDYNMYINTNRENPTGVSIGYYNFGTSDVWQSVGAGLIEFFGTCTGTPPSGTTTTTTTTAGCKQSGESCTNGFECCSGICTGGSVCGEPE